MISYITQLQTIRADNKILLNQLVDTFSINKCIKEVVYYNVDSKVDSIAKHMAYVYFTTPPPPIHSIISVTNVSVIQGNIDSAVFLTIKEAGILFSGDSVFTTFSPKILVPYNYGNYLITSSSLIGFPIIYLKPYITTCLGITYGEIIVVMNTPSAITDSYGIGIMDSYGEFILEN